MATAFFGGNFFSGEFFSVSVVPTTSVYYPVGHPVKRRKKRKYDSDVLFADIESSLRELVFGPAPSTAPVVTLTPAVAQHVDESLSRMLVLSENNQRLARRLAVLQRDLAAYEQRLRNQEEEDMLLMLL